MASDHKQRELGTRPSKGSKTTSSELFLSISFHCSICAFQLQLSHILIPAHKEALFSTNAAQSHSFY